jgi:cytochrome c6
MNAMSKSEIIFCGSLAENSFVNLLIPFIGAITDNPERRIKKMRKLCTKSAIIMAVIFLSTGIGVGQDTKKGKTGREEFQTNCLPCHPDGGNAINPEKPVTGSKKLANFKTFLSWIRNPVQSMTKFPPSQISDKQARELYDYILAAAKKGWK